MAEAKEIEIKTEYKLLSVLIGEFQKANELIREENKNTSPDVVCKIYHLEIKNSNDIVFRYLKIMGQKRDDEKKIASFPVDYNFHMTLGMYYCCVRESECDGDHDDEEEAACEDCNNTCPPDHKSVHVHDKNLAICYTTLMDNMHDIFKCRKCRETTTNKYQFEKDELICYSCLFHEDIYTRMPDKIKKRKLFDCYVCSEEKMNSKYRAELKCPGANKHTDQLCKFCLISNRNKCPQCKQ
jgi:hypothetical protein